MNRRLIGFLALALVALLLAGCRDSNSPFPLDPDLRFGYRLHLESEGLAGAENLESFAVNLPPQNIDGVTATPRLFADGKIIYYAEDKTGIRETAFRDLDSDVTPAGADQYVLRYPLTPGAHWRGPGRTILLTQKSLFSKAYLFSKALPATIGLDLDYIVGNLESVHVPAGNFDCVKVTATGRTSVTAIDIQSTLDITVEIAEWYAPGIGLVKSIRTEKAGIERAGNAKLVTELDYFKKPGWFE